MFLLYSVYEFIINIMDEAGASRTVWDKHCLCKMYISGVKMNECPLMPERMLTVCVFVNVFFVDERVRYIDKHLLQLPCYVSPRIPRPDV